MYYVLLKCKQAVFVYASHLKNSNSFMHSNVNHSHPKVNLSKFISLFRLLLKLTMVALLYFDTSLQVKCDFWTWFICSVLVAQGIHAMGFKHATVNFALHFK